MDSKIKAILAHKSSDEISKICNTAMSIKFVVDLLAAFGVYIALKTLVSQFWADCWIALAFMAALKENISLMLPMLKKSITEYAENEKKKQDLIGEVEPKPTEEPSA